MWCGCCLRPLIAALRRWDYRMAQRDSFTFVAISTEIQARIQDVLRAGVVDHLSAGGPDAVRAVVPGDVEDYYLVVSRLIPYKRIDLAVRAFTELGLPLVVAGDGRDRGRAGGDGGADGAIPGPGK